MNTHESIQVVETNIKNLKRSIDRYRDEADLIEDEYQTSMSKNRKQIRLITQEIDILETKLDRLYDEAGGDNENN